MIRKLGIKVQKKRVTGAKREWFQEQWYTASKAGKRAVRIEGDIVLVVLMWEGSNFRMWGIISLLCEKHDVIFDGTVKSIIITLEIKGDCRQKPQPSHCHGVTVRLFSETTWFMLIYELDEVFFHPLSSICCISLNFPWVQSTCSLYFIMWVCVLFVCLLVCLLLYLDNLGNANRP